MKAKLRFILPAAAFVIILAAAVVLYPRLSAEYKTESVPESVPAEVTAVDSSVPAETGSTAPDTAAPDFTVTDRNGNRVTLSEHVGRPVVVNMWATWCGQCKSELPAFNALYEKYGDKIDFMMVDLTDGGRNTVESASAFVDENGYTFPVYFDTEYSAAAAYSVYSIPETVFIDADGNIYDTYIGAMDEAVLEGLLTALIG